MQGVFVVKPKDLSSTEPYQRDNLAHFFMCASASILRSSSLAGIACLPEVSHQRSAWESAC